MRKILVLCLMLMFSVTIVSAASLDEPAEKKVTVRSEIERGKSAVFNRDIKIPAKQTMKLINAVSEILNQNQQSNTDTEAFYFGVYGEAWASMVLREEDYQGDQFYQDRAASYYKQFRTKQKELNISDGDLLKLFTIKEEWLAEWDKKTAE